MLPRGVPGGLSGGGDAPAEPGWRFANPVREEEEEGEETRRTEGKDEQGTRGVARSEPHEPRLRKPRSGERNAVMSVTAMHVLGAQKNSSRLRVPRAGAAPASGACPSVRIVSEVILSVGRRQCGGDVKN